jgi:hypothetical protein
VINHPTLVLDEISRQATNLFTDDRSRLIISPDWFEFFNILQDAAHFIKDTEIEITHADIESALRSWVAEEALAHLPSL